MSETNRALMGGALSAASCRIIPWISAWYDALGRRSVLRETCLILALGVVLGGALDALVNPEILKAPFARSHYAGRSMQAFGAIAGFYGAFVAAESAERSAAPERLLMLIPCGCKAGGYYARRITILLAYFGVVGYLGATCSYVVAPIGAEELFVAWIVVYVPTVFYAIILGFSLTLLTRSKALAILIYASLWIGSVAWSLGLVGGGSRRPEWLAITSVTGEPINLAFFEQPMSVRTPFIPELGLSYPVWEMMSYHDNEVKRYSVYNIAYLLSMATVLLLICLAHQIWSWKTGRINSARPGPVTARSTKSSVLLVLKSLGLERLGIPSIIATFVLAPFAVFSADSAEVGRSAVFAVFPYLNAASVLLRPRRETFDKAGGLVSTGRRRRIFYCYCMAVQIVFGVLSLLYVCLFWSGLCEEDPVQMFCDALIPTQMLLAIALLLNLCDRKAAFAFLLLTGVWLFLVTPAIFELSRIYGFSDLHPFVCLLSPGDSLSVFGYLCWLGLLTGFFGFVAIMGSKVHFAKDQLGRSCGF